MLKLLVADSNNTIGILLFLTICVSLIAHEYNVALINACVVRAAMGPLLIIRVSTQVLVISLVLSRVAETSWDASD